MEDTPTASLTREIRPGGCVRMVGGVRTSHGPVDTCQLRCAHHARHQANAGDNASPVAPHHHGARASTPKAASSGQREIKSSKRHMSRKRHILHHRSVSVLLPLALKWIKRTKLCELTFRPALHPHSQPSGGERVCVCDREGAVLSCV